MSGWLYGMLMAAATIFGYEMSKRWFGARAWHTIWLGIKQRAWGFVWVLLWKPDEIVSARIYETPDDEQ